MPNQNIKALNSIMLDKQFKLSDFIPEFSKFLGVGNKKHISSLDNVNSLFMLPKKVKCILNLLYLFVRSVVLEILLNMVLMSVN